MILKSKRVWKRNGFEPAALEIADGKIKKWLDYSVPAQFDFADNMVLPGFIDIHTHGGFGCDIMKTDASGVRAWAQKVPVFGTTSFVATTFTDSEPATIKAIRNVASVCHMDYAGAEILGINLEGPFIGLGNNGGMEARWIRKPDIAEYDRYQQAAEGSVCICTVAPEREGAFELIDHLVATGVIPSAGHTEADYDTINRAVEHGLRNMTHTYNCMTPLHHRRPGCVGAAMLNDALYCECICDDTMVSAPAAKILSKMKGRGKLIFITDSLALQGQPPGQFFTSGFQTEVCEDGSCVEVGTGMYMGSTLGMNSILKTAVTKCKLPMEYAVDASSYNAAVLLGLDQRKGRILPGYDADIAVLRDDFTVTETFCRGKVMLKSEA